MTDRMSSSDIDRVLANIRKLVSVEEGARPGSGGRLVLTSDLRVDGPRDAPEEAVHAEDVVATEAGWPTPDLPEPTNTRAPHLDVVADSGVRPRSLKDRIDDLQAVIRQEALTGDQFDGSEGLARSSPDRAPLLLKQTATAADTEGHSDLEDVDPIANRGRGTGVTPLSDTSGLRFFHAAPEDRFDRPDYAGRDDPLEPTDDEQQLDEDALRDLVAEIVREELAGALGERITRNVRKLVRREIMRTLSTRDLE